MARRPNLRFQVDPNIAEIGALIGDPARAAMLLALLDGGALPASELAFRGGVSPQAASAHLAKLVAGGLLGATAEGRHRLFRLASPDVGHALEAIATIARPARVVALSQSTALRRLREARSCYDHLAGRLGVAVTGGLVARGAIRLAGNEYAVTRGGERLFAALDVDVPGARAKRRSFARACTDWTERRPHLGGSLGAGLRDRFLAAGWVQRNARDRSLRITDAGRAELARCFGVHLER
ncbi:MAG TPA: helix-turn-helix domain-containing protein [Candidatus Elarobacter sp.]|nr:helix-turn-helix domain-containing protein [Candidatus Elarobacter sp.]